MSTDRELLEQAAKAAGKEGGYLFRAGGSKGSGLPYDIEGFQMVGGAMWNPLRNDGDAFRLAVKLGILDIASLPTTGAEMKADPLAAVRRAIVRAAADIGRGMSSEVAA